jgi:hypothetical protein
MQGSDGLLIEGFDGNWDDVFVPLGLEESLGIGAIGLVALSVAGDVGGRKERDPMAQRLKLPPPVMGGATGLHEDVARRPMEKEVVKASAREPMLLGDAPRPVGHGNLKNRLCEIDGDVCSVHEDSSPVLGLRGRNDGFWHIGAVSGEESIPSLAMPVERKRSQSLPVPEEVMASRHWQKAVGSRWTNRKR